MDNQKRKTIAGTAGSPGVAEGLVKVVDGVRDISRFDEGDVLVTKMTEPAMVIMMNKAAAIVTDVGGITCHAAIVSRELGIPCVVATKIATKELKDGFKARVDGDKGEIEILNE